MTTTTKKPKAPKTLAEVYSKDVRDAAYARVVHLDPAKVHDNPWQPRAVIDPEDLKELAESIHAQGLLQPPVARFTEEFGDECQLAFGHRRVAAIRLLLKEGRWSGGIPVSVQELSDADMVLMALAENAKRKDLSILEEVKAYDKALAEVKGLKITNLAQSIGMSRSALSNQLRLLNLPDVALEHLGTGKLTPAAAREILVLATGVHRHDEEIEMVIEELQKSTSEGPWKVDHVRRQIIYVVAEHAGRKWRPMSKPGNADGWEDVERKAPAFDVSKFKEEHSDRVHKIPHRYERGSREWTCHGRKWDQLQKVATKGKEGEEEIQKLKTWSTLMKMVPVFEEALGESVPRETEDGVIELTDDQKLKLGTLAELAENTGAQWGQFVGQTANRQGFFSDPAECYERCIKGAQFGTNHQGQIRLFCFNKEHYEEKEALGQQEYMDSLKPEQEASDYQDADIVKGLVDSLDEASARALGLVALKQMTFGGINQGGEWHTREYSYHPKAVREAMEIMGVKLAKAEGWGRGIDQDKAIEAFNELGEASARQVAARLLSYLVRYSLDFVSIEKILSGSGGEAKS